jgi:hypothetical protein
VQFFRIITYLVFLGLALGVGTFLGYELGYFFKISLLSIYSSLTVAFLSLAIFISTKIERIEKDRQLATSPLFFIVICFISTLVLSSSISSLVVSGNSSYDRMAGFIPYSDANAYYRQILNWPSESFDEWNSRRSFNGAFNIFKYDIAGFGLLNLLFFQVILASLGVAAFAGIVARQVGACTSIPAIFASLIWMWPYVSSTLSEINGITISLVAFTLFISALYHNNFTLGVLALLAFSISYAFRPYNPLIVLIMGIGLTYFMKNSISKDKLYVSSKIILLCSAIFFTLLIPKIPFLLYGHPDASINSNTGTVLLGFARGTNWSEAYNFFIETYGSMPAMETNRMMSELALKVAIQNPMPLVIGLAKSFATSIFVFQYEFGRIIGISPPLPGIGISGSMEKTIKFIFSNYWIFLNILIIVMNLYLLFSITQKKNILRFVIILVIITFLSFSPIVFTDGGWRVTATLYPGLALLILGAPIYFQERHQKMFTHPSTRKYAFKNFAELFAFFLLFLFLFSLVYPNLSRAFNFQRHQFVAISFSEKDDPRWRSSNQAVTNVSALVEWAKKEKYESLAIFFERNKSRIQAIHYQDHYYTDGTTYMLYLTGEDISSSERELLKKYGFNIQFLR